MDRCPLVAPAVPVIGILEVDRHDSGGLLGHECTAELWLHLERSVWVAAAGVGVQNGSWTLPEERAVSIRTGAGQALVKGHLGAEDASGAPAEQIQDGCENGQEIREHGCV